MEKEYSSLRDEILKWQDKRITFSQIAITLVTAYTGYMLSIKKDEVNGLSWQIVSIFPLLILSITMHINKVFELFQLRAAAFLAVFHSSIWEIEIGKVSLSKGRWRIGYNKSMAIVYLLVSISSTLVFIPKYSKTFYTWETVAFGVFVLIFLLVFKVLFTFGTKDERRKLIEEWTKIKNE